MEFHLDPKNPGHLLLDIEQKYFGCEYAYIAEFYTKEGAAIDGKYSLEARIALNLLQSRYFASIPRNVSPELFFQELKRNPRQISKEGYLLISRYRHGDITSCEYAKLEDL
ncbi:MAG: hypothetical protein WC878_05505 [Candidatus Paceibacterota bacterium]|jgi:hypothetical protein